MTRSDSSPVSPADKAYIISMIEDGFEDEDILEVMPHVEKTSITAFRAHVTRGTYSQGDFTWKTH